MIVELLTEHHLEFLSLKGGCRGSSESTHVKMPHCWKPHALGSNCIYFESSLICHLLAEIIVLQTVYSHIIHVNINN